VPVLQSVGADGIFQHGEAEGIGPDLVDGSAGFGAELKEQGRGEQAGLDAIDGVEALAQADRGTIDADPVDAEDFDIQSTAEASAAPSERRSTLLTRTSLSSWL